MDPVYEKYKPIRGEKVEQVNCRLPVRFKDAIDLLATIEDCSAGDLALEGVMRVLEDRGEKGSSVSSLETQIDNLREVFKEISS
jgi:hypothetical protein